MHTDTCTGELALGMGLRVVADHPTLDPDRTYTIVGQLQDRYLVDATPPGAERFAEQRTATVCLDEIEDFSFQSSVLEESRIWMAENFAHALQGEGFSPEAVRIVREWPQPRKFPIIDPFEALPLLAEKLSTPRARWSTISGWIIAIAPEMRDVGETTRNCAVHGIETCLLRSPSGELFDFGSQCGSAYAVKRGEWRFKLFAHEPGGTHGRFVATNAYFNFGMMGEHLQLKDCSVHAVPFRAKSGLDPSNAYDRMLHNSECILDESRKPLDPNARAQCGISITRKAANRWYELYQCESEAGRIPTARLINKHLAVQGCDVYRRGAGAFKPLVAFFQCDHCAIVTDERLSCG